MNEPKPRGRPKTGAALTPGERSRRLIGKADAALHPDTALVPLPDSVLLLALPMAYRAKSASAFARIAGELSRRMGISVVSTDNTSVPIHVETTDIQPSIVPVATTDIQTDGFSVATTDIPTDPIPVDPTDKSLLIVSVDSTDIQTAVIPVDPTTNPDKAARDRRILELAGIPERRASEILKAEGFKCSPRTVANVRKRLAR